MPIRYDTLEQDGSVTPLAARLEHEVRAAQATPGIEAGTWFTLAPVDGYATVPAGSETKWITMAPDERK